MAQDCGLRTPTGPGQQDPGTGAASLPRGGTVPDAHGQSKRSPGPGPVQLEEQVTCMQAHTHAHAYRHTDTHMHAHRHAHACTFAHACTHTPSCTRPPGMFAHRVFLTSSEPQAPPQAQAALARWAHSRGQAGQPCPVALTCPCSLQGGTWWESGAGNETAARAEPLGHGGHARRHCPALRHLHMCAQGTRACPLCTPTHAHNLPPRLPASPTRADAHVRTHKHRCSDAYMGGSTHMHKRAHVSVHTHEYVCTGMHTPSQLSACRSFLPSPESLRPHGAQNSRPGASPPIAQGRTALRPVLGDPNLEAESLGPAPPLLRLR